MNEKKEKIESENWKSDEAREARKERLAQLKDKEGKKKPIKTKGKTGRIVSILLALAIVIGFVIWFLLNNGYLQTHKKAFTVSYDEAAFVIPNETESMPQDTQNAQKTEDAKEAQSQSSQAESSEEKASETEKQDLKGEIIGDISVAEANIYLGLMSQQYLQGGAFSQTGQDALSKPSQFNPNGTLRDDFLDSVERQAKTGEYFYWQAQQNGYELDEADLKNLDNIIAQYTSMAAQGQVTLNHYLSIMFGPGVTENVFRDFFTKNTLGNKYYNELMSQFTYDQATIDATYEANPDNYNVVDYRSYLFTGVTQDEKADSAKPVEPDLEKAKQEAEDFLAKVSDEASFKKLAETLNIKNNTSGQATPDAEQADTSLSQGARKAYLSPDLSEWLFAADRAANDTAIIEESNGYRVVLFLDKYKPTNIGFYDSRHILFKIDENDPEKTEDKMKAKAEEVLAEYNAGQKTEEAFADLAIKYSDDPGSASNGGLYKSMSAGQFVPEYEEFTLNPNRKAGDVEIVKSMHGYHIIYFISNSEQWQASIEQELRYKDEQTFMSKVENATDIRRETGVKYFGRP